MLQEPETIQESETLTGTVLNGAHGIYDIHTTKGVLRCTLRGKLKKAFAHSQSQAARATEKARPYKGRTASTASRQPRTESDAELELSRLSVGDRVKLRQLDASTGLIEEILPRQSALKRRDVRSKENKPLAQTLLANLDQVVLVFAVAGPDPHFGMLDRYLLICESAEISPLICLNKMDLPHSTRIEDAAALYTRLGYTIVWSSIQTGEGIDQLRALLKDRTSLFTGPSGVGKSSLVNTIEPGMAIRTGLISDVTGKGRHTTTGSQLYPLSEGGWLADSAGIRALTAWNIPPEDMAYGFVEFRPYLGECAYTDCQHLDEEDCAIRQAVSDGLIDERRYKSYVRIFTGEER